MSHADRPYLVVALSGRALAQSARRSGARVVVIDRFDDADTRSAAERSLAFDAAPDESGFDLERLLAAAYELCPPVGCAGLVPGSGFEAIPGAIDALARAYPLLGNTGETIARVKDPLRLAAHLDDCGFPRPELRLAPPEDPRGWVAKRVGASGGGHVEHAEHACRPAPGTYFQRRAVGVPHSLSFVADGRRALVLGFNRTWTRRVADRPYCYGGAINRTTLSRDITRDIVVKLDALVERCGLVGVNGIDFVAGGHDYAVIEINPRPCATLDLYDDDYPEGVFGLHVEACRGRLPEAARLPRLARAHSVYYTSDPLALHPRFALPSWCRDRPAPGARFAAGSPVCTVHAAGKDAMLAMRALADRERTLAAMLAGASVRSEPHEAVA